MSDLDIAFIRSDAMKWGIIFIVMILIMGTMLDLYFSLVVRTFYLTFMTYPDILNGKEFGEPAVFQHKSTLLKESSNSSPSKKPLKYNKDLEYLDNSQVFGTNQTLQNLIK